MRHWSVLFGVLLLTGCDKPIAVKVEGQQHAYVDPVGRYQLVAIPKTGNDYGTEALVLDTQTGNMWRYGDYPGIGGSPSGFFIKYLGRVEPAFEPGQLIVTKQDK